MDEKDFPVVKKINLKALLPDLFFWLDWLATIASGIITLGMVFEIISLSCSCSAAAFILDLTHKEPIWAAAVMGLMIGLPYGLLLGLFQWILLRKRIERLNRWVIFTGFGGVLGWAAAVLFPVSYDPNNFVRLFLHPIAISGVLMSVFQGWASRRTLLESLWWVLAAVVPWICISYAESLSSILGINNVEIPLMLFSAGIISAAAVYVFGQSKQRKLNALTFLGVSLVALIIWGIIAKI